MLDNKSSILVPYDGTEISDKAVTRAIEFTKAFNSEIILLHAIKENLKEAWNEMAQDRSINNITKENIKSTLRVVIGSPSEKILEFANANQIDLIIMGSQRLETISKIKALGSVSRKVSEAADCPVLIVH
jgi:nucleotide-binding universal stress UspA family protein